MALFQNLADKLDEARRTLKGRGRITDVNIASTVKEIRRALLDADVNYKVAKEVTDKIKDNALGQKIQFDVNPGHLFVNIMHEELTNLMGGDIEPLNFEGSPAIILMSGLQGSGKTTFSGKLANFIKSKGRQVLLTACDVYRPAAIEQIKVLGEKIGVDVYAEPENKNPIQIAENAIKHAKANHKNVVIVDTAGRLAIDEEMMQEIESIKKAIKPQETLFVVDSMTGQDAVNTAKTFNDRLDFDGVVLTKLDGDSRGGAALSIKAVVNKPIKFISEGEDMESIQEFFPNRMAGRILDMGDIQTMFDKAKAKFDEKEAERLQKKMRKNQFDFEDFLSQLRQIKKMGNLKDLIGLLPGMGKALKDVDIDDNAFVPIEAMILSMTPYERSNPKVIDASRKKRISKGSGTTVQDVNNLLKQFEEMKKMMKKMNQMQGKKGKKGRMPNLGNMLGG